MLSTNPQPELSLTARAEIVRKYGGSAATALLDPACDRFATPGIEGLVAYQSGLGYAVAIGDPVAAPADIPALAFAFQAFCRWRRWHIVYAAASGSFAHWAIEHGYGAAELGEELVIDPLQALDDWALCSNVDRESLVIVEHHPDGSDRSTDIERAIESLAVEPSMFGARRGKRWFYAQRNKELVGALSLVALDSRGGYLVERVVATADAPIGIAELLLADCIAVLGKEGCDYVSLGPAPSGHLRGIVGLSRLSGSVARAVCVSLGRIVRFARGARYRQKLQAARSEPSFVLFRPPHVGVREAMGLLRALKSHQTGLDGTRLAAVYAG